MMWLCGYFYGDKLDGDGEVKVEADNIRKALEEAEEFLGRINHEKWEIQWIQPA